MKRQTVFLLNNYNFMFVLHSQPYMSLFFSKLVLGGKHPNISFPMVIFAYSLSGVYVFAKIQWNIKGIFKQVLV